MELCKFRRRYIAMMYVASCGINGIPPQDAELLYPEGVCALAAEHTIGALVCHGFELASAAPAKAVTDKNLAIRKIMLFDAARRDILRAFDEAGIEYMVLKGVVMKELYPAIGLRQMSDNDILIDPKHRKTVKKIMQSLGYSIESYGKHHHDVYMKEPVYNFEIHVSLFSIGSERLYHYFKDALAVAQPSGDGTLSRRMTDEQFYLYTKAHEYKHYIKAGIGLRSLIDTYVYLKAKAQTLDMEYVTAECAKMGIDVYEEQTRALAEKLLSPDFADSLRTFALTGEGADLTDEEWEMLDFFASSGTYGKISTAIAAAIKEYENGGVSTSNARFKYLLRRLFPGMNYYKENAPVVYKYKILIPFYCVGRLIRALIRQPGRVFAQIKSLFAYKKEK